MEKTKKIISLKNSRLFGRAYRKGKCTSGKHLAVYALPSKNPLSQLGITVSKERGNAVIRNRIKRRIREAYRSFRPFVKDNTIIVIVARQACVDAHFTVIKSELHDLLTRAALLDETE